jgi:putrescine transport system substrate-binding protein
VVELERPKTRRIEIHARRIANVALLSVLLTALGSCGRKPDAPADPAVRIVNFYSWSDYIDPGAIATFERETGIRVNHDVYDSNELLQTKLLTGRSGYDVVVVGGDALRMVGVGALQPLDRSRLPNWSNLDSGLMAQLAELDPENRHLAGYLWGTTGIAYDAARVRELAPDAPTDSWRLVFDPAVVSRFTSCGVSIVEARSEVLASALIYLGRDPNSAAPGDLHAAQGVLEAIRPSVRKIDVDSQINDLVGRDICVMLTWPTSAVIARARLAGAGDAVDIRYVIPREGAITWFDTLGIPADAPHLSEAHAFIDFLMRPEVAAATANYVGNSSMNMAALPRVLASLRDDSSLYPSAEVRKRLTFLRPDGPEQSRAESRVWTRFRTGQ